MRLFGRDPEIAAIQSAILSAQGTKRRGVAFVGEEGLGKTSLLQEAHRQVSATQFRPLIVRARESGTTHRLALASSDWLTADGLGRELAHGRAMHESVELEARPTILLVDDFDRLPSDVAAAVLHLFRFSRRCAGLVLTISSTTPLLRDTNTTTPALSSDGWLDMVLLKGLDVSGVSQIVKAVLGSEGLPSLVGRLHQITTGNPLFVQEMLNFWQRSGSIRPVGTHWELVDSPTAPTPDSLTSLADDKLSRRSAEELDVLRVVILMQRPCSYPELEKIFGSGVSETVVSLCEDGLLSEDDGPKGPTYGMSHPLLEDRLLANLGATRKRKLHGRIADALRLATDSGSTRMQIELAVHISKALKPPPDTLTFVAAGAKAAVQAGLALKASELARSWLEHSESDADRYSALIVLGNSMLSVDPTSASDAFADALPLASDNRAQAEALIGSGVAARRLGHFTEAFRFFEGAAEVTDHPALRFDAKHNMGALLGITRRYLDAERLLNGLSQSAPDAERRAKALGHLAQVSYCRGRVTDALRIAREAISESGPDYRSFVLTNAAWYSMLTGMWPSARTLLDTAAATAEPGADLWNLSNIRGDQARLAVWTGNTALAIELASEALQLAKGIGNPADITHAGTVLAEVLGEIDQWHSALQVLEDLPLSALPTTEPRDAPITFAVLAEALHRSSQTRAATAALAEGSKWLVDGPHLELGIRRVRAQIALDTGDPAGAREICSEALELPFEYVLQRAALHEIMAESSRLCRDRRKAVTFSQTALDTYVSLGAIGRQERVRSWLQNHGPGRIGRPKSKLVFGLTEREVEILWLVTRGQTSKEIGSSLFIAEGTVRKHIESIKGKAGVNRRTELVTFAASIGITPDSPPDLAQLTRD